MILPSLQKNFNTISHKIYKISFFPRMGWGDANAIPKNGFIINLDGT